MTACRVSRFYYLAVTLFTIILAVSPLFKTEQCGGVRVHSAPAAAQVSPQQPKENCS